MHTRDEAVEYLQQRGFYAVKRDWSLGETVLVAADPIETDSGLLGYRRLVYVFPEDGRWGMWDMMNHLEKPERSYPTLSAAVQAAVELLEHPDTGTPGRHEE